MGRSRGSYYGVEEASFGSSEGRSGVGMPFFLWSWLLGLLLVATADLGVQVRLSQAGSWTPMNLVHSTGCARPMSSWWISLAASRTDKTLAKGAKSLDSDGAELVSVTELHHHQRVHLHGVRPMQMDKAKSLITKARSFRQAEQYTAALRLLEGWSIAAESPRLQAAVELEVGRCLTGLLNTDCAALHLRESVRLDPTNEMALAYLGQSLGAQKLYKEGLELLEDAMKKNSNSTVLRMGMGLLAAAAQDLSTACSQFEAAAKLGEPEGLHALYKCRAQQEIVSKQHELRHIVARHVYSQSAIPVQRVSNLTYSDFLTKHALPRIPVILTDVKGPNWSLEHIERICGDRQVPLKQRVDGGGTWADLEYKGTTTVRRYIEMLRASKTGGLYLFDWGLPLYCPELLHDFLVPKYVASEWLHRVPALNGKRLERYQQQWPALFIGGSGSSSGLHIDSVHTHFYTMLVKGHKKWKIFPPDNLAALYYNHLENEFPTDAFNPDLSKYPLMHHTQRYECTLGPGEMLFVPANAPHQVENVDETMAVSGNFVDSSNWQQAARDFAILSHRNSGSPGNEEKHILEHWQQPGFNTAVDFAAVRDMPWSEYILAK